MRKFRSALQREKAIFLFAHLSYSVKPVPEQYEKQKPLFWLPHSPPWSHNSSCCLPLTCRFLPLCLCTYGSLYLECSLCWLFVPFISHLKCQLLSEAFINCSAKMDLLLFFSISIPTDFFLISDFSPHRHCSQPAPLQTCPSQETVLPNRLSQKPQFFWVLLICPQTHIQRNCSPKGSVSKYIS